MKVTAEDIIDSVRGSSRVDALELMELYGHQQRADGHREGLLAAFTGRGQPPERGEEEKVVWPSQCTCGHLFLEKYTLREANDKGEVGFCWCGFCRTKRMVKPPERGEEQG